ncbi:MAG: hypothetical protein Alis3KO_12110 [Aliiglaciecola sp.]
MPNLNEQQLLAAWMEGELDDQQRQAFEQRCAQDEEFAQQVQMVNSTLLKAQDYQAAEVPSWDRASTFEQGEQTKWWQWSGFPALSTALSIFAVVLVFSGFEAQVENGQLTVSFNKNRSSDVQMIVDQRLAEFQQNQQLAMNAYAQSLREQQLDASTQLTNYLLASSRQERKEDFGELIKFINEQRSEDQIFYARQLNQLQQEIFDSANAQPWSGEASLPVTNE